MSTIHDHRERMLYSILGPLILIAIWIFINKCNLVNSIYLPPLEDVIKRTISFLLGDGVYAIFITLYRTLFSLLIAGLLAIPLGLFLGFNKKAYAFSEVTIDFFRSVPATAFFPIFLLFFGVGDMAKIAISAFVVFWILLVNTIYGVWESSETRLKVAKVFKASQYKIFTNVIIFDALPQILIGVRLSISIALVITIVSEMFIGTQHGLGKVIYDSYVSYDTTQLFATIFVVGVLGYAINKLFIVVERKMTHWVGK
ncbi:hypothetical protein A2Z00_05020 [Candidatus Gottesmanbacteria bacterium RBG_13_45_10]|uniref:ABC transmembrane type-1 domain-containing protein n=1 Tax=Candidatus Gottesmanbacteria bacterium RBG_13_45_10 TaxID=1798370 RepID=A0A1F5ZHI5_9BACT|nr:MAG: hypothetical protein A2Z00_05020 [Candidatus Gottesmanbacteria bacterium RBG_13_45_10]